LRVLNMEHNKIKKIGWEFRSRQKKLIPNTLRSDYIRTMENERLHKLMHKLQTQNR
jgi:hypothetical protein